MSTPKRSHIERESLKQGGGNLKYKNESQLRVFQEKQLEQTKDWMKTHKA